MEGKNKQNKSIGNTNTIHKKQKTQAIIDKYKTNKIKMPEQSSILTLGSKLGKSSP